MVVKSRLCLDCKKSSDDIEFHLIKNVSRNTEYYNNRCIGCNNIYRHKLKCRGVPNKNCIKCERSSDECLFGLFKLSDTKIYLSCCRDCEKYIDVPERFCLRCKCSSLDKEFRTKKYPNGFLNTNYCKECEKFVNYQKFCDKYNLEETCKFCDVSSKETYFNHYKLRDSVLMYDYCIGCTDKNDKIEIKLCSECGKKSNDFDFSIRQSVYTGSTTYVSKCKECVNKKLNNKIKSETQYWIKKYTLVIKQLQNREKKCNGCNKSSNDVEFIKKTYGNTTYNSNICKMCYRFENYKTIIDKYEYNIPEKLCNNCNKSSNDVYFSNYTVIDKIILNDNCYRCLIGNNNIDDCCNYCGKFCKNNTNMKCLDCNKLQDKYYCNTINAKLNKYKKGAYTRGHLFELTYEKTKELFLGDCVYCGKESLLNMKLNGIDRVDNTKGYTLDNCVSCCKICNFMKRVLTKQTFIAQCKRISSFKQ